MFADLETVQSIRTRAVREQVAEIHLQDDLVCGAAGDEREHSSLTALEDRHGVWDVCDGAPENLSAHARLERFQLR